MLKVGVVEGMQLGPAILNICECHRFLAAQKTNDSGGEVRQHADL
jgi:hypothetical protein